jgi:hypothetical protein
MDAQELHDCKECGAKYCSECGDAKKCLCYDCLGWNDEEIEEGYSEEEWEQDDLN